MPAHVDPPAAWHTYLSPSICASNTTAVFSAYYLMAVLAILPGALFAETRVYRRALLPVVLLVALRAATSCELSGGDPEKNHYNNGYSVVLFTIGIRAVEWTFLSAPLSRIETARAKGRNSVLWDAFDLIFNFRGVGWNQCAYTPPDPRPTHSTRAFLLSALWRGLALLLTFDTLQSALALLSPTGFGARAGGTIFDASLAPLSRYAYATLVTLVSAASTYIHMEGNYYLFTVLVFLLSLPLGVAQDPAHWPPLFDRPFRATSLRALWTARWHQCFRRPFLAFTRPVYARCGRAAGVLAVFALSGVLHECCMWSMGRGGAFVQVGGFFTLMGGGVLVEEAWTRKTGRTVGGPVGWVWTMACVAGAGTLLVDAWLTRGGVLNTPQLRLPERAVRYFFQSEP